MAYSFNPTASEAATLAQIAQRESGGNYTATVSPADCTAMGQTVCTASGAYQFIDSTWQHVAQQTGVGTQYASAADAPAWVQDINALWLLRAVGPNSSASWGASSGGSTAIPGSATQPLIDLSGDASSTPTPDILSSLQSSVGAVDMTDPTIGVVLLASAAAAVFLIAR